MMIINPQKHILEFIHVFGSNPSKGIEFLREYNYLLFDKYFWDQVLNSPLVKSPSPIFEEYPQQITQLKNLNNASFAYFCLSGNINNALEYLNKYKWNKTNIVIHFFNILNTGQKFWADKKTNENECFLYYSKYSIYAISKLLTKLKFSSESYKNVDDDNLQKLGQLLLFETEKSIAKDMIYAILFSRYYFNSLDDNSYTIKPDDESIKAIYNEKIKFFIKQKYIKTNSSKNISDTKEYKKVDTILRTDAGIPSLISFTPGLIIEPPAFATSIDISDLFQNTLKDNKVSDNFINFFMNWYCDNAFPKYYVRDAMEEWFTPKELINIKKINVKVSSNFTVKLEVIFWFISILKARTHWNYDMSKSLDLQSDVLNILLHRFSQNDLIGFVKEIDDLKDVLSDDKIIKIFNFIENKCLKAGIPFLIKIDNDFSVSQGVFMFFNVKKEFFEKVIAKEYFSTLNHKSDKQSSENSNKREKNTCKYISSLLKRINLISKPRFEYISSKTKKTEGEIDVVAVSLTDKIILNIQVKLSNTNHDSHFGKWRWGMQNLIDGASRQINRSNNKYYNSDGLKQLENYLELRKGELNSNFEIINLIVTDNFYYDHYELIYDENNKKKVLIISLFELEALILEKEIFKLYNPEWIAYNIWLIRFFKNDIDIPEFSNDKDKISFINKNKFSFWDNEPKNIFRLLYLLKENIFWKPHINETINEEYLKSSIYTFQALGFERKIRFMI